MLNKKKLQQFGGTVVAEKGKVFKRILINGFSLHKWYVRDADNLDDHSNVNSV